MMPFLEVLIALRAEITAALAGKMIAGKPITVRHHRHRDSIEETEWPCVAIRFISNDASDQFGRSENGGGMPEQVMDLQVNLVIDMALAPEAQAGALVDEDPTGYGDHAAVIAWILDWLFPDPEEGFEPNLLSNTCWMLRYDGTAPEEGDATPDAARMEERLSLFYRVRADRPTHLLRSL